MKNEQFSSYEREFWAESPVHHAKYQDHRSFCSKIIPEIHTQADADRPSAVNSGQ